MTAPGCSGASWSDAATAQRPRERRSLLGQRLLPGTPTFTRCGLAPLRPSRKTMLDVTSITCNLFISACVESPLWWFVYRGGQALSFTPSPTGLCEVWQLVPIVPSHEEAPLGNFPRQLPVALHFTQLCHSKASGSLVFYGMLWPVKTYYSRWLAGTGLGTYGSATAQRGSGAGGVDARRRAPRTRRCAWIQDLTQT
jgi:hypothetical protein